MKEIYSRIILSTDVSNRLGDMIRNRMAGNRRAAVIVENESEQVIPGDGDLYLSEDPEKIERAAVRGAVCIACRKGQAIKAEATESELWESDAMCSETTGSFFRGAELVVEDQAVPDERLLQQVWCRGKGISWRPMESERIYLKELDESDVPALHALYEEASVQKQLSAKSEEMEKRRQKVNAYRQSYRFYGYGIWGVFEQETDQLIGVCGLEQKEWSDVPELGYVISEKRRGMGYATEAARMVLALADWIGLKSVTARIRPENTASVRVAERIGMRFTEYRMIQGEKYGMYTI